MDDYVAAVVDRFPSGTARDVILIGHSMGGAVISHVAAHYPDRISALVYVAAMLPDDTESVADIIDEIADESAPWWKTIGDFLPHASKLRLVKQPFEPLCASFERTADFEALPRGYVLCTGDDVIPPRVQRRMLEAYQKASPATRVVEMPSGHLPQFDYPDGLFAKLTELLVP